jgi:hypothetical protein
MLGSHFYNKLTRKYVTAMGTLFNNITVVRQTLQTGTEIERFKVPVRYGPKEKWLERINADADLDAKGQISLPMISFVDASYTHDPTRKRNPLYRNVNSNDGSSYKTQYTGNPYNITWEVSVWGRTTTDADQIIEQILPTFNPDYTIPAIPIDDMGFTMDTPVILESVTKDLDYEGDFETLRVVRWTLTFTMKTYFWGPVANTGLIRTVFANTYIDPTIQSGAIVRMNLSNGNNGVFKIEDTIYQGNNLQTANAAAIVLHWSANNSYIRVGGAQGQFVVGQTIRASQSNAAYTIASFDATPLKVASIKVEPDPIDAEPTEDFGYTTTYIEYPETLDE